LLAGAQESEGPVKKVRSYALATVDVFTDSRFGGNPLAVFTDGRGLSDSEMQALAREMNLSETTFVLPPEDPANTARVRIFNRTCEMAFAGHPNVGTAFVLAASGRCAGDALRFEERAGPVEVRLVRDEAGEVRGAAIDAPHPLSVLGHVHCDDVAACVGIRPEQVVTRNHLPTRATLGLDYVITEVAEDALSLAVPNVSAFERTAAAYDLGTRLPILIYCRSDVGVRARMFAPLVGTLEDPATGGGMTGLAALLLSISRDDHLEFEATQGVEMGRPSLLSVRSWRADDGIRASVAGQCVPVITGEVRL
jgi:trans-2,3-dihydro-3-hydroxyanthranilate isomerase